MVLARFQRTIVDDAGNILPGALVTVRSEAAGAPLAVLYSDRAGATPIGNPFAAGIDGFASFHVAGGAYRITATSGSSSIDWRYVGIGLASESDAVVAGVGMSFSASTTDADPGAGFFKFNNATLASVTTIYMDNAALNSADITTWLDSFDDGGSSSNRGLITIEQDTGDAFFFGRITGSIVDGTGYRKITVTPLATFGTFVAGRTSGVVFNGQGVNGISPGLLFNFDSSTSMADPGNGDFRLNNATLASVTAAAFDDLSSITGNPDVSAVVLSWDDSTNTNNRGTLLIKDQASPQNFALYRISGTSTDNAGWTQLVLTHVASAGSFTNGNTCSVEFSTAADPYSFAATSRVLGRATAGAGAAEELTLTQILDFIGSAAQGDILYRGSASWARLPAGSAGQSLQSGGAAANPAWGGAPVLLASGSVSSAATLDLVLTAYTAYRGLLFVLANFIPATDNVALHARVSTNGGSSYDASASNYRYAFNEVFSAANSATASTGATEIKMANSIGNGAAEGISTIIELLDQINTAVRPKLMWRGFYHAADDNTSSPYGGGYRGAAQDTDAIRFLFSSGNIASGKYAVYGLL